MSKVLVGEVSPTGESLIRSYLDKYMPDVEIVPLKMVGYRGQIKLHGGDSDVIMIILGESMYSNCQGIADDVLKQSNVHKYIDDAGLKQFLIANFGESLDADDGVLNSDEVNFSVAPTTDVVEDSETIQNLRDELIQKENMIDSLSKQLQASASTPDDIKEFVTKIRSLEEEVSQLKAAADTSDKSM